MAGEKKAYPLRISAAVLDARQRWSDDELRSLNAQIELLLRQALIDAGRMPKNAAPLPRRGRPLAADCEHSGEEGDSAL